MPDAARGVVEESLAGIASLRASRRQAVDVAAALRALGHAAPAAANRWAGDAARSCAWIEPRAWLLLGALPGQAAPPAGLLLTDVSDRHAAFRLTGPLARRLLAAAGLAPERLGLAPGRCANGRFAEETVAFVQQLAQDDFRLLVDAPLRRFAADWLRDAADLLAAP